MRRDDDTLDKPLEGVDAVGDPVTRARLAQADLERANAHRDSPLDLDHDGRISPAEAAIWIGLALIGAGLLAYLFWSGILTADDLGKIGELAKLIAGALIGGGATGAWGALRK